MAKLYLQLVTPEKVVLNEELDSLSCPTELGQITVLPNHIPLVATLVPGELTARSGKGEEHSIHVAGGFVEIRVGNKVIILADTAEHAFEINVQKAEEAVARAQSAMKEKVMSAEEYAKVAAALQQSLIRLNIARKHAHRKAPITGEGVLKD